ncbi:MAG TPA: Hg(II)-responsive transcriptional regulator [Rhizomicrobium sp.]
MDQELTIGRLAAAAGVNVETIRFYQRKGMLSAPKRRYGSIRRYGVTDLMRINFIKAAQRLGFSLHEISELLALEDGTHCREAREQGERKLADVRVRIADLKRVERALSELLARCSAAKGRVKCPLIASLHEAR